MAPRRKTTVAGVRVPRGENLPSVAKGWRIETPGKKYFKAALVTKFKVESDRFAIFRVLS